VHQHQHAVLSFEGRRASQLYRAVADGVQDDCGAVRTDSRALGALKPLKPFKPLKLLKPLKPFKPLKPLKPPKLLKPPLPTQTHPAQTFTGKRRAHVKLASSTDAAHCTTRHSATA
jgi:hypothetical protein